MFHNAEKLCKGFIDQAVKTWNWIEYSRGTGIRLGEESITDFNLIELSGKYPDSIRIQKFSKRREATTGADWEWWFTSGGFWLGLRVQAKKIDPEKLSYPHIKGKNAHRQIKQLIDDAMNSNPPRIPIYVFYNQWDPDRFDVKLLCFRIPGYCWRTRRTCRCYLQHHCVIGAQLPRVFGCGMSHAIPVKWVLDRNQNSLEGFAGIMYPWSCLVCCRRANPGSQGSDLPSRVFDFLSNAFRDFEDSFDRGEREKMITKKPPEYVYYVQEGKTLSDDDWEKIGVNGVMVISETEW